MAIVSVYLKRSELKIGTLVVADKWRVGIIVGGRGQIHGFVKVLCPDGETRMFNDSYLQRVR